MILPAKVIYNGQAKDVVGYVGTKYRFNDGSAAPMSHCSEYVEPIEDINTVRSEPAGVTVALSYTDDGSPTAHVVPEPKPRKGGRPRKVKEAE